MMASPWQASSGSVCHWVGSHHVGWHEEAWSVTRMASLTPSLVVTLAWFQKCGHTAAVCPGWADSAGRLSGGLGLLYGWARQLSPKEMM